MATSESAKATVLTPEQFAAVVLGLRKMSGWTQETLAELSGLQTRTIQRVERGDPSSLDTRRALARAFGFDDLDVFNRPMVLPTEADMRAQREQFDRDHVILDAASVDGRGLLLMIAEGGSLGAICPADLSAVPREAQDDFAGVVDFVRDCADLHDEVPRTELLAWGDTLRAHPRRS